jgi:hypothetical protein
MAAVHQALVGVAQMRSVAPLADFVSDDKAVVALRGEIPSVIKARHGAGGVALPTDSRVGHELIDPALERKSEAHTAKDVAAAFNELGHRTARGGTRDRGPRSYRSRKSATYPSAFGRLSVWQ